MLRTFYENNRRRLFDTMPDQSVLVLFSGKAPHHNSDHYYPFFVQNSFRYMIGFSAENFILLLVKRDGLQYERLYIDPVDELHQKTNGRQITPQQVCETAGIQDVRENTQFISDINLEIRKFLCTQLWLDLSRQNYSDDQTLSQRFACDIRQKYPALQIRDASPVLNNMRRIKQPEEIEKLRKAADITNKGIQNMMIHSKPGMYEYEYEAFYSFAVRRTGAPLSPGWIFASGDNAVILHYPNNDQRAEDGTMLLCDLGVMVDGYNSDVSRTFPVNGKFTPRQAQIYEIVLNCNKFITSQTKPGVTMQELDAMTKAFYARELKKIGLIQEDCQVADYYYHFISHYLGLDTHDVGNNRLPLEPGVVITIEPGLYIEEEGLGIRIEDDVLVTEDGCIVLTKDIPREISDIERLMCTKSCGEDAALSPED